MKADRLLGEVSRILVDVAGRDVAFSDKPLSNKELLEVRERINTLIAMNLREEKEHGRADKQS
jgi:hypothetical protein